jgi:hypothetical protein
VAHAAIRPRDSHLRVALLRNLSWLDLITRPPG